MGKPEGENLLKGVVVENKFSSIRRLAPEQPNNNGYESRKGKFFMKRPAGLVKRIFISITSVSLLVGGVAVSPAKADAGDRTLIIHYSRTTLNSNGTADNGFCDEDPCDKYDGWNLWLWQTGASDSTGSDGFQFDAERDGYGVKATIPVTNRTSTKVGFLVRIGSNWSWAKADVSDDRFINMKPTGTTEVWLKQDDPMIYDSNPNDRVLRIHYNRPDNKFTGWDILTQEDDAANNQVLTFSSAADCYGRVASLNLPDISQTEQKFILRKGGNALTFQSEVFTVTLSEKKYTDFWLDANLFMGEDITFEKQVGEQTITYLDMTGSLTNPTGNLVAVHYSRPLQDYTGWTINHLGSGISYPANLKDSFGRIACVYETDRSATSIVITIGKGATKDLAFGEAGGLAGQRTINITGPMTEVWIKQGSATIFEKVTVPDVAIKKGQVLSKVPFSIKKGKSVALPMKTDAKLAVKWTVITPQICAIKAGKLAGKSKGTCKLGVMQAGNAAYKLYTNQFRITVN